jgi:hypothetical protein
MAKLIKPLELEFATFRASKQQLNNLIITGHLQLQMTCKKILWKSYEILYISFNTNLAWFLSLIGWKDEATESGLLQTESNQIWVLTLNIYNSKTT